MGGEYPAGNRDVQKDRVSLGFGNLYASIGDHVGHFYRTTEEWREIVVSYYKVGLESGEKCVYLTSSSRQREELQEALGIAGVQVEAAMASGQLMLHEGKNVAKDRQHALAGALAEVNGFRLLRSGGDMTWTETLMEWETHINMVETPRAVFLCQYDLTAFNGNGVMDALRTHPVCIVANVIHQNPYYEKPEDFLEELQQRGSTTLAS